MGAGTDCGLSLRDRGSLGAMPHFVDLLAPLRRVARRALRRRRVARAYDMAKEIAPDLSPDAQVLDVGCGSGFIAHHLIGLRGARAVGVDVACGTEAAIPYTRYEGRYLPFDDATFDAVLLCYVLHHSADPPLLVREARRVLRPGGRLLVYEDLPITALDRLLCRRHEAAWRARTGPCTFHDQAGWRAVFNAAGFSVSAVRRLSRWRNLGNPVARVRFTLECASGAISASSG
ncbi:MAG: class I SAM-dependent methyltransferase [Proteobacteria bacterium]|nr:class I SAM-dependent methyltransferase [Pseudomonadota bacterium]